MKEAHKYNLVSGSTATVILLADAQILVANIGDSKAFLCSEKFQSPTEAKGQQELSSNKIAFNFSFLVWADLIRLNH